MSYSPYSGSNPYQQGPPPKKSNNSWIIILVVLGVMGVGALMCVGILAALMLPALQGARHAARTMQSTNNMKQIGLALHNYESTYRTLPPAFTTDAAGNKLHSWRVLLLPFMEQKNLYDQINLDEPWNSTSNSRFHDTVPDVYRSPIAAPNGNQTSYVAIVGANAGWEGAGPISFVSFENGLSNVVMVAEIPVEQSFCWMAPDDISPEQFVAAYSSIAGGEMDQKVSGRVLFADGSVINAADAGNDATLKNWTQRKSF